MLKLNSAATSRHVNTLTIDVDKDFDGRLMLYIDQGVLKNTNQCVVICMFVRWWASWNCAPPQVMKSAHSINIPAPYQRTEKRELKI